MPADPVTATRLRGYLDLRPTPNGHRAIVLQSFTWVSDIVGDITIAEQFDTDYNSTPRIVWRLFPRWEYPLAGVVHDWLYLTGRNNVAVITRGQADDVHEEILIALEAPRWKSWSARFGLRVGGWKSWNNYRTHEHPAPT